MFGHFQFLLQLFMFPFPKSSNAKLLRVALLLAKLAYKKQRSIGNLDASRTLSIHINFHLTGYRFLQVNKDTSMDMGKFTKASRG